MRNQKYILKCCLNIMEKMKNIFKERKRKSKKEVDVPYEPCTSEVQSRTLHLKRNDIGKQAVAAIQVSKHQSI